MLLVFSLLFSLSFACASRVLTLSYQCFGPEVLLLGIFSCSVTGDEQALVRMIYVGNYRGSNNTGPSWPQTENLDSTTHVLDEWSPPWTDTPICTQILDDINEPLCIYTNSRFASGRGISILTKPSKAEKILQLSGVRNTSALSALNSDDQGDSWCVVPLKGRGMGMLAARPFDFGDAITAYTPVFVAAYYVGNVVGTQDLEYLFRRAIDQLPPVSQEKFLALAHFYDSDDYRVQDIVRTNCFEFDVDGEMHLAVYPETSRINHSCGPK